MESKWLIFQCDRRTKSKITKVWSVVTKDGNFVLGEIKWFGRWRGYAFFVSGDTIFEKQCLRDLALFIEDQNTTHRLDRIKAKAALVV